MSVVFARNVFGEVVIFRDMWCAIIKLCPIKISQYTEWNSFTYNILKNIHGPVKLMKVETILTI